MKRLTAFVSGKVQRVGYRARVIQLANGLGLKSYSQPYGEFDGFFKLVGTGETDSRLDEGIGVLKDMRDLLISICGMQKQMLGKQDQMLGKQDQMLGKQEETILEIKDMNRSLNEKMDKVLDKSEIIELKSDVSEMKSALRAKGII